VVKRYARLIGRDVTRIGTQSLRSGFVTEGLRRHIERSRLKAVTRHRTEAAFEKYDKRDPRHHENLTDQLLADDEPR
jgi:hypothetical protein